METDIAALQVSLQALHDEKLESVKEAVSQIRIQFDNIVVTTTEWPDAPFELSAIVSIDQYDVGDKIGYRDRKLGIVIEPESLHQILDRRSRRAFF
jgi:hypothetical protein